MRFSTGCALASGVAVAMAVIPAALYAQAPNEGTRPAVRAGQGGPGRRANAFDAIGIHGFSIVLVVGDMQGTAGANDTVPGAARKALADMRDFLPYKNYRLLDAEWMLCCGGSFGAVAGRVRGPEEQDYSYSVTTNGVSDSKITVHFSMRESPSVATAGSASSSGSGESGPLPSAVAPLSDTARADYSRQLYEVSKEREEAMRQVANLKPKVGAGVVPKEEYQAAEQRYARAAEREAELRRTLGQLRSHPSRSPDHTDERLEKSARAGFMSTRSIMDSTFSIAVGETVVIGTSRLKGEKALIALLTAAGKPKPSPTR
jgi:BMFP domain-containing protein YqiC